MSIRLSILLGKGNYEAAIEELRDGLAASRTPGEDLALIAECYVHLGSEDDAVCTALEAVALDDQCYSGYRTLARIYAQRGNHSLGVLNTRNAIRTFRPRFAMPWFAVKLLTLLAFIRGGREAAARTAQVYNERSARDRAWLDWAVRYVEWSKSSGALVPSNDPIRSVTEPKV